MNLPEGYDAARAGAAFLERRARGKIAVAGQDRKTYLHAMLTNDIVSLQPGSGCQAAYLTPQGRMVADLRVFEVGDLVLLELRAEEVALVLEKLDAFVFSEDVRLGDLTEAFTELRIGGPGSADVVGGILDGLPTAGDLAAWPEFSNARASFGGETVFVAASREWGVPAFDLFVERPHAGPLAEALARAGAAHLSEEGAETLRVEAGTPAFGRDMDTETIPLEAGIESRAISFTKGCYPGQEVIVRVMHRGHGRIARRLVALAVEGEALPAAGDAIAAADAEVGRVTSAVWSPQAQGPIALGYVKSAQSAPGTPVVIKCEARNLAATVSRIL
jgi:tRNA-modifying protein YgfZ